MGSTGNQELSEQRKPRFLCLHGFRTSGEIMKKQIHKWPQSVLEKMDLIYLDAPFPAEGKSDVEGIFDPPYYEWFQFDKEFVEYRNFDECLAYIEECFIKYGPIDGLMGFSQGAILSAALPGLQAKGLALKSVPKIKFLIIIGGAKFKSAAVAEKAYSSLIECPSLHFLGETDFLKPHGITLLDSFVNPIVIHHPKGHTVPRLDEKSLELMWASSKAFNTSCLSMYLLPNKKRTAVSFNIKGEMIPVQEHSLS
ncbi:esterase AGAP003155-like [Telopea speciosissima]|uniref:esterase AGAP003155-like n=1 Tax=Telopea speciosissima TaxID=54955 RepID=UPI001CC6D9E4|nr:esterase AGAP003155-like [Telopea speciosissima]